MQIPRKWGYLLPISAVGKSYWVCTFIIICRIVSFSFSIYGSYLSDMCGEPSFGLSSSWIVISWLLLSILLWRREKTRVVLCKPFSLKKSSLGLHHFIFICPVWKPATAYPKVAHIFQVFCDYFLSLYTHFLSLCLSTCMSSSTSWSNPWGKQATAEESFSSAHHKPFSPYCCI